MEVEVNKLDKISELTSSLIELKKKQSQLKAQEANEIESKCAKIKKMRLEQYKKMTKELDAKERDLCRKTNQLVDELVAICEDTPFHKALLKILRNLKGTYMCVCVSVAPRVRVRRAACVCFFSFF